MNLRLIKCENWKLDEYNDFITCESENGECNVPIQFLFEECYIYIPKDFHETVEFNNIFKFIRYVVKQIQTLKPNCDAITFVVDNIGTKPISLWERAINKWKSRL
jgi:hypothetical protein